MASRETKSSVYCRPHPAIATEAAMPIPTITTGRLTLRAFHASDWDDLAVMNADPLGRQWLGGTILSRSQTWTQMEVILGQWALRGYGMFAVEVGGCLAGRVGLLHPVDWPETELAWTMATPFWGKVWPPRRLVALETGPSGSLAGIGWSAL
jgi:RimJ/RimL family protein N-acetyltransferase